MGLYSVHFVDIDTGWVVGDNGTILRYDGGTSWLSQTRITSKDIFSVYFIDESTSWIVGEGGLILHTSNGSAVAVP